MCTDASDGVTRGAALLKLPEEHKFADADTSSMSGWGVGCVEDPACMLEPELTGFLKRNSRPQLCGCSASDSNGTKRAFVAIKAG